MMQEARRLREIETQAMARGDKNLAAEARAQMARQGIAAIVPDKTPAPVDPVTPPAPPETMAESTPLEVVTPPKAPKKPKKS